jgi:hypothetical protein
MIISATLYSQKYAIMVKVANPCINYTKTGRQ